MDFILVLFIVLVGGGWLMGKLVGELLFPKEKDMPNHESTPTSKEPPVIINNYKTEQHLHITNDDLKKLMK